jgi:hypothetical protein
VGIGARCQTRLVANFAPSDEYPCRLVNSQPGRPLLDLRQRSLSQEAAPSARPFEAPPITDCFVQQYARAILDP